MVPLAMGWSLPRGVLQGGLQPVALWTERPKPVGPTVARVLGEEHVAAGRAGRVVVSHHQTFPCAGTPRFSPGEDVKGSRLTGQSLPWLNRYSRASAVTSRYLSTEAFQSSACKASNALARHWCTSVTSVSLITWGVSMC